MTFRDYLQATRPELPRPASVHPSMLQSHSAKQELRPINFNLDAYDLAWQDYLICGGFPRAVFEHQRHGRVSEAYARDIIAWLRSDVDPDAPLESVPLLLAEIAKRMTSQLNITATSQALGYASKEALTTRVTRLINSHAALRCHQRNDSGYVVVGAQSKLYLTDPLLAWCPAIVSPGLPIPDFTKLSEAALGIALARVIDNLDEGRWVAGDTIGYARTGSGNEIDFAPIRIPTAGGSTTTTPIESKWVDDGWRAGAKSMKAKYGHGIIATKSLLDLDYPSWAVPAPLLALLLS